MVIDGSGTNGSEDPPRELVVGFWKLVGYVKVGVMAFGFGVILLLAEYTIIGLALIGVGSYVVLRWGLTYRRLKREHDIS